MACKPRQIIGSFPQEAIAKDYNRYGDKIIGDTAGLLGFVDGSISTPIYTNSVLGVLFSEVIDPATVATVGDGTGSFEVYDNTGSAWVAGAIATTDNLTFSFTPTSALTPGSSYTIFLSQAIKGSATGRSYSGEDFSFTAEVLSNASFWDDAKTTIAGYTITEGGNSSLVATTFDGETVWKYTDSGYNAANLVQAFKDTGANPAATMAWTERVYITKLNTAAENNCKYEGEMRVTAAGVKRVQFSLFSDMVRIADGAGNQDTPYTIPQNEQFKITLVVNIVSLTTDIYINDTKIATGVSCDLNQAATTEGRKYARHRDQENIAERSIAYVDYVKVGDGLL